MIPTTCLSKTRSLNGRCTRSRITDTSSMTDVPRLYSDLASWFHLLSRPEDYAEEAESARKILSENVIPIPRTVLELGAGGGNNALHLKHYFQMTLADASAEM